MIVALSVSSQAMAVIETETVRYARAAIMRNDSSRRPGPAPLRQMNSSRDAFRLEVCRTPRSRGDPARHPPTYSSSAKENGGTPRTPPFLLEHYYPMDLSSPHSNSRCLLSQAPS
jgi:hypothetical protein